MKFVLAFIFNLFILANLAFAATHPLTGSSIINQPTNGMALTQMGFSISSVPADWNFNKSLEEQTPTFELGQNTKTQLSFRLENVSTKTQLEAYVRQYLRDYNQYGLEVVSLQSHSKSPIPAIIVDLKQKNSANRSRQVFYYKPGKIVIATCSDESRIFDSTIETCNKILSTFKWRN